MRMGRSWFHVRNTLTLPQISLRQKLKNKLLFCNIDFMSSSTFSLLYIFPCTDPLASFACSCKGKRGWPAGSTVLIAIPNIQIPLYKYFVISVPSSRCFFSLFHCFCLWSSLWIPVIANKMFVEYSTKKSTHISLNLQTAVVENIFHFVSKVNRGGLWRQGWNALPTLRRLSVINFLLSLRF